MNEEKRLPLWVRHSLIGVGLFFAGALLAFGYSYRPLHGALAWQVDQLETRIDERNRENTELRDALVKQEAMESTRIDPDTLAQVKKELVQTKRVLDQAEKDLKRADRKRKESVGSAATWRKRFEDLRDSISSVATTVPRRNGAAPSSPSAIPTSPVSPTSPAAPAGLPGDAAGSRTPATSQPSAERGILSPNEASGSAKR